MQSIGFSSERAYSGYMLSLSRYVRSSSLRHSRVRLPAFTLTLSLVQPCAARAARVVFDYCSTYKVQAIGGLLLKYNSCSCCDRPAASPRVRQPAGTTADACGGGQPTGGTAAAACGGGQPTRTGAVTAVTVTVASSGNAVTGLLRV